MKGSDKFKEVIQAHLQKLAERDPLFAKTLGKPNKNIDDCITYILNTVKKSGRVGFADEEIFDMAIHYYDEDDLKPGKPINAKVVVNHSSAEEKKKTKKKVVIKEPNESSFIQGSLF